VFETGVPLILGHGVQST